MVVGQGDFVKQSSNRHIYGKTFSLNFKTRPKAEIDDLVTFFVSLGGVDPCKFTYADSNAGGSETAIKATAIEWTQTFDHGDFYSLSVTLNRVYEP